jgi:hypothetical protein
MKFRLLAPILLLALTACSERELSEKEMAHDDLRNIIRTALRVAPVPQDEASDDAIAERVASKADEFSDLCKAMDAVVAPTKSGALEGDVYPFLKMQDFSNRNGFGTRVRFISEKDSRKLYSVLSKYVIRKEDETKARVSREIANIK